MLYLRPVILLLLLLTGFSAQAIDYTNYYEKLDKRHDTGLLKGQVQVLSFFDYYCARCQRLEPKLTEWAESMPDKVDFRRVPNPLAPDGDILARIFYTTQNFDGIPKLQEMLYRDVQRGVLWLDSEDALSNFIALNLGVDSFDVLRELESISVNSGMLYAKQLVEQYQAFKLPCFIVNGRYRVYPEIARTDERLFEVLDYLVNKELQR